LQPITPTVDGLWEWTATVKEGKALQYKYTRGSWEQVEQWGTITGTENRHVTIVDQGDGKMLIDDTATDWGTSGADDHRAIQGWRDPLVASVGPAANSITATKTITVTFTLDVKATDLANVISVKDSSGKAVAGDVKANGQRSFIYSPKQPLKAGKYEATVTGVESDVKMSAPYTWTFTLK
jgi:Bacterial Ig-like domain